MALFGLPGGAELLVIGATVLLLFFPGALLVWIGFVLGRRSAGTAGTQGPDESAQTAGAPGDGGPADDESAEMNDGD
jgi:hypothetical protein